MHCVTLRCLYVKANGDIPCFDDYGERIRLGRIETNSSWSINDVLEGEKYKHLVNSLSNEVNPWEGVCDKCALLENKGRFDPGLINRHIDVLQLELSLHCSLKCPACSRPTQLKVQGKPYILQIDVLDKLLSSLAENKYSIGTVEYCGQGEPLSHPDFVEVTRVVRCHYPDSAQRLVTNGNYIYKHSCKDSKLDEIIISIDGADQCGYEKYRIGGSFEKAVGFMKDAKSDSSHKPYVMWKYILFAHNDSDDCLMNACKLAEQIGVDALRFVLTETKEKSDKYHVGNIYKLNAISRLAYTLPVPSILSKGMRPQVSVKYKRLFRYDALKSGIKYYLDSFSIIDGTLLLQGWALSETSKELTISAYINEKLIGVAITCLPRRDVAQVYSNAEINTGFQIWGAFKLREGRRIFTVKLKFEALGQKTIYEYIPCFTH